MIKAVRPTEPATRLSVGQRLALLRRARGLSQRGRQGGRPVRLYRHASEGIHGCGGDREVRLLGRDEHLSSSRREICGGVGAAGCCGPDAPAN